MYKRQILFLKFLSLTSTTCRSKSADFKSSRVALKDSINEVGRLDMNPTVSVYIIESEPGTRFFLVTVSKVANNLSA